MFRLLTAAFAAFAVAQDPPPAPTDWAKEVERACSSPRIGLRIAAGKKIATAAGAAIPALQAWSKANGVNALPVTIVEAFADHGGNDAAVLELLGGWAQDVEFYWRAQALRGLALRRLPQHRPLFARSANDPAWLFRTWARIGLWVDGQTLVGGPVLDGLLDPDPRAQVELAAWLFSNGEPAGAGILMGALCDERTFLGDPWGRRRCRKALTAVQTRITGNLEFDPDKDTRENVESLSRIHSWFIDRLQTRVPEPLPVTDTGRAFVGGIEIASCRHGDLFLRWTADGFVWPGLEETRSVRLRPATWQKLWQERTALRLAEQVGVVVCDKLRLRLDDPAVHAAVAPAALPAAATDWLKQLAAAIEEGGDRDLAEQLRTRLRQFAAP
ncbi:MAG: hypothetical protein IPK26_10430 [Planctomycetes bacterium]|nr:hypothetical protein [Planctomycetota bacterium]